MAAQREKSTKKKSQKIKKRACFPCAPCYLVCMKMKYDWRAQILAIAPQPCAAMFEELKAKFPSAAFEERKAIFEEYILQDNNPTKPGLKFVLFRK